MEVLIERLFDLTVCFSVDLWSSKVGFHNTLSFCFCFSPMHPLVSKDHMISKICGDPETKMMDGKKE